MEYDDEVFARIEGYENYAVSNYARVLNIDRQYFMATNLNKDGYLRVRLSKNNHRIFYFIHRLVAKAFIKNENQDPLVDHINRNRLDNSAKNLRWVDYFENASNRTKPKNTTSRYIGVCLHKKANVWFSYIKVRGGKIKHLGSYNSENDAGIARNNYIIEHNLQEFYPLNEIN
jgi:hypothetical protein